MDDLTSDNVLPQMSRNQSMEGGEPIHDCEDVVDDDDDFNDFRGVPTDAAAAVAATTTAAEATPNDPVASELDFESDLVQVFNHNDSSSSSSSSSEGSSNKPDELPRGERDNDLTAEDHQGAREEKGEENEQIEMDNTTSVQEKPRLTTAPDNNSNREQHGDDDDGFGDFGGFDGTSNALSETSKNKEGHISDAEDEDGFGVFGGAQTTMTVIENVNSTSNNGVDDDFGVFGTSTVESSSKEEYVNSGGDGFHSFKAVEGEKAVAAELLVETEGTSNLTDANRDAFGVSGSADGLAIEISEANDANYEEKGKLRDFDGVESAVTSGDDTNDKFSNTQFDGNQKHARVNGDDGAPGFTNAEVLQNEIPKEPHVDLESTKESKDSHDIIFENSHHPTAEENTESLSMADTRTPKPEVLADKVNEVDQFGAFDSALDENPINDQQSDDDADFGDFGDFDSAPLESAVEEEINGSADSNSDDDDFGDFGGADETFADNSGNDGAATLIPAQPPAPQPHSTESGDAFLNHARSKFQHLFSKFSQDDPTGKLNTKQDSPNQPPASIAEILLSLNDKVDTTKRESKMSESVLKVLRGTRKSQNISPQCIISDTTKGPYSHFKLPINVFDPISTESKGQTTAFVSADTLQLPFSGRSSAADESSYETKHTSPVLTDTVVALPPLSVTTTNKEAIMDTAKSSSTAGKSQEEPGRVDRLLSQVSDLSFMLSSRLSLPKEKSDPQ